MTQGYTVVIVLALCWLSLVGGGSSVRRACAEPPALPPRGGISLGASACLVNAEITAARNAQHPGQPLDATAQYYLRPWFGELVEKVRVVWQALLNDQPEMLRRVFLIAGSRAQTYGYQMYIAPSQGAWEPGNTHQLILLAHELVHTEQYVRTGESLARFCEEYMQAWAQSRWVYTQHPFEREAFDRAFAFAQWLAQQVPAVPKADQMVYKHEGDKPPGRQIRLPRRVPLLNAELQRPVPRAARRP